MDRRLDLPADNVRVTQHVEVGRGERSGLLDTVLIAYTLENLSPLPHKVGLRVMLDTYIGANDGVPFVIPGQPGLLTTWKELAEKDVPDYVEALEKPDLNHPGTVAHLGLKGVSLPGVRPEPIRSLLICGWPGSEQRIDIDKEDRVSISARKDSCVFLYWPERVTRSKEKRHMAFTYGLGRVAVDARDRNARLGLTVGGSFQSGGTFTVIAYIKAPKTDQKVQCTLPDGLTLVPGEKVDKVVAGGGTLNQVSWRVRATRPGTYILKARSEEAMARIQVHIRAADRARD